MHIVSVIVQGCSWNVSVVLYDMIILTKTLVWKELFHIHLIGQKIIQILTPVFCSWVYSILDCHFCLLFVCVYVLLLFFLCVYNCHNCLRFSVMWCWAQCALWCTCLHLFSLDGMWVVVEMRICVNFICVFFYFWMFLNYCPSLFFVSFYKIKLNRWIIWLTICCKMFWFYL